MEADTIKKMNYKRGIRKGLETNWFKAADAKYEREIEQKIGIPEKITVQEQLDHYRWDRFHIEKCDTQIDQYVAIEKIVPHCSDCHSGRRVDSSLLTLI